MHRWRSGPAKAQAAIVAAKEPYFHSISIGLPIHLGISSKGGQIDPPVVLWASKAAGGHCGGDRLRLFQQPAEQPLEQRHQHLRPWPCVLSHLGQACVRRIRGSKCSITYIGRESQPMSSMGWGRLCTRLAPGWAESHQLLRYRAPGV